MELSIGAIWGYMCELVELGFCFVTRHKWYCWWWKGNPAWPNIVYYTTRNPWVFVCKVAQDLHHQQWLLQRLLAYWYCWWWKGNPAWPNIVYYTTRNPWVFVCKVAQDLHHQQWLLQRLLAYKMTRSWPEQWNKLERSLLSSICCVVGWKQVVDLVSPLRFLM